MPCALFDSFGSTIYVCLDVDRVTLCVACHTDHLTDNSYKGNAYGLANTLFQTAKLKPSIKPGKVKNLYFAGQLTSPGPGVPPSIISGQVRT